MSEEKAVYPDAGDAGVGAATGSEPPANNDEPAERVISDEEAAETLEAIREDNAKAEKPRQPTSQELRRQVYGTNDPK